MAQVKGINKQLFTILGLFPQETDYFVVKDNKYIFKISSYFLINF